MKYLVFFFVSLSFNSVHAVDYSKFEGRFVSQVIMSKSLQKVFGRKSQKVVETKVAGNSIEVTFVRGFDWKIIDTTVEFKCKKSSCKGFSIFTGCEYQLDLDLREEIIGIKPFSKKEECNWTKVFLEKSHLIKVKTKKIEKNFKENWEMNASVDKSGRFFADAKVKTESKKNEVVLSCQAPKPEISMHFKLDPLLWRALAYSYENKKMKIDLNLKTNERESRHAEWSLENENEIFRTQPLSEVEVSDLKKGSDLEVEFFATRSVGDSEKLAEIKFSLSGSSKAINSMSNRCRGQFDFKD